ncbi:MAG: hypothetical protein R6X12_03340 [bacterium]
MKGPYRLSPEELNRVLPRPHPGNFAIGYRRDDGRFVVRYVGRSDSDLNRTLREQETDGSTWFAWSYAPSEKAAFDKECRNYHDFGESAGLENEEHPLPPGQTRWHCPVCGY